MASTYNNNLRLNEMGTGDQSGTWGVTTNTNLSLITEAFSYQTEATFSSDADVTATVADGASDKYRAIYVKVTSGVSLSQTRTLTIAPNTISKIIIIENATTGSQSITISQGSGASITVANGNTKVLMLDGGGSGAVVYDAFNNLSLSGDLTIEGDDLKMGTNTSGHVLVADGTNYNPVAMSGDATIAANGAITIANDAVEQAMIADDAVGADQLASNAVVNASVSASAAIAFSKMENLTASRALVSDSNGDVSVSAVTATEVGYLDGVTSAIQTQLNNAYSSDDTNLTLQNVNEVRRGASATGIKNETDHIEFYVGSTERATLDSSGNFTADGNLGAYSDVVLKEDIYQIENALEKVNQLRGVHFTRKANNSKEIGVVANEVEKVVPELVDEHLDKELGSIKIMKYANTVGLLIEAVKDLSKQVEELKNGSTN
jgi:hypothetical protein